MFTDQEKHDAALQFMDMLENIDKIVEVSNGVTQLSLEDFTSESWSSLQMCQNANIFLLLQLKTMLIESSKLFENDALLDHINAVVTSQ